jgi:hypothetical protein
MCQSSLMLVLLVPGVWAQEQGEAQVAWTEAGRAVVDHLVAEPGPVLWAGPHGLAAVVASVRSGGGAGADPAAVQFRKTRIFLRCQMHFVVLSAHAGGPGSAALRTWREPGAPRAISPIGEGGRPGPDRRRPWVNFTARFRTDSVRGGGEVIGDGAEQAGLVRLTFTSGTPIEDRVENGVVLFAASPGVESRARVEILSSAGVGLAEHDEFDNFYVPRLQPPTRPCAA